MSKSIMDPSPSYTEYPVVKSPAMSRINLDDTATVKPIKYQGDNRILTLRIMQSIFTFGCTIILMMTAVFKTLALAQGYPASVAQVYIGAAVASTIGFSILAYFYVTTTTILKEQLALRGHLF